MSRVYGIKKDYAPVRQDASRTIVSYNLQPVGDEEHYTWNELYFNKRQNPSPSLEQIQQAVLADINAQATERIKGGFVYDGHKVWLSVENQNNYKAAADLAYQTDGKNLPVTFKFGDDVTPDYVTFDTTAALLAFWTAARKYIDDTLTATWQLKDSIDWKEYAPLTAPSGFAAGTEEESAQ